MKGKHKVQTTDLLILPLLNVLKVTEYIIITRARRFSCPWDPTRKMHVHIHLNLLMPPQNALLSQMLLYEYSIVK